MWYFVVVTAGLIYLAWFLRGLWRGLSEPAPPDPAYSSWAQQTRREDAAEQ